jgi:predicted amidohydrolase
MYDLVIAGGRVIDPAQGLDGRYDVAFAGGKVSEVAPASTLRSPARRSQPPARWWCPD